MTITIDFIQEAAVRCGERLTEAGYSFQPTSNEDAIRTYVSIRHRRVRQRPRQLHKATYAVPAHLAAGEQSLLAKVQVGDDLWPHQSRKIGRTGAEDGMLNDYGIQHFHLGTNPDPRHAGLIQGTCELLFAVVRDDDFYAIGIYDHEAWSKQQLLDIVHATWPSLTEPYTLKSGDNKPISLSHTYTDEEAARLRAAGINVLQQRPDGKIQMGLGGGIATDCSSIAVTREADSFIRHLEMLQQEVADGVREQIATSGATVCVQVKLKWDETETFAVIDPFGIKIDLTGQLAIPPL